MLEEMDSATLGEWIAFDSLEPLDPAGALLAGFSGGKKNAQPVNTGKSWQEQYEFMSTLAGK